MRRVAITAATLALALTAASPTAGVGGAAEHRSGEPSPRIVGGSEVSPVGAYPFAAALLDGGFFICGGSLVSPTWVLTAAHCLTDGGGDQNVFPATLDIAIGRHDLTTGTGVLHDVANIVIHPEWATDVFSGLCGPGEGVLCFDHDIALVELATPSAATPVVLATAADATLWDPGDVGTVMGWGVIVDNPPPDPDEQTTKLHEVDVPFHSTAECVSNWGDSPFFYPDDVCAGAIGVDSCTGDSGGPLVAPPGKWGWHQVGIVSFGGTTCGAGSPIPVYTKVSAYTGWVTSVVGNIAPQAFPGTATVEVPTPIVLRGGDSNGHAMTFSVDIPPGHGSLGAITGSGDTRSVVYTPHSGYSGADAFSFSVDDGLGGTGIGTVTLTVTLPTITVGLVDVGHSRWHLYDSGGALRTSFFFGNPGDVPIAGDWDGDGIATPGLYRQSDGFFYARDSNTEGPADNACFAGDPSDEPVAGDWDGDGDDNLGLYRPSEQKFYLFTTTCTGSPMGAAQVELGFGNPGDRPVAGDWDGDDIDEVGLHRPSTGLFYWRNTLDTGNASGSIIFGDPADRFVAGDFGTPDGADTPGLFRPTTTTFYFRHTLTQGVADDQFAPPGAATDWLPVAGSFGFG